MKTLVLVDGSSYLYRAFHALPDLRTKVDEPTGAIYGVLNMLRRIYKDYAPDYSACVFDAKGKTFRDAIYPDYKATRSVMPSDLERQIEPLCEAIEAMGWPLLTVEGVEADDVIGTLAREAERAQVRTIVSTSDKDLAQLVTDNVTLINTMSIPHEVLDVAGVKAKFGVPPEMMVEYLAIIGDSIDNIPGVAKAGPKTAAKWLRQYGSLDGLLAHAGEISGQVGDNLRASSQWLPRARELLEIKRDVPLPVKHTELAPRTPDYRKLAELFDRFEFKSWRRELPEVEAPIVTPVAVSASYDVVLSEQALASWLERVSGAELTSIAIETTHPDRTNARVVGLAFAIEPGRAAYIPLAHRYAGAPQQLDRDAVLNKLKPWLEDASRKKLGSNIKDVKHVLANHGIALRGAEHDTCVQSYVIESHRPHDLPHLAERHLNAKTLTREEVVGRGAAQIPFEQVSIERAAEYCGQSAAVTLQVHELMSDRIARDDKLAFIYREIEMPVADVLFSMERHGVL
ncbi:MAG TPA: 5'-3' exonuclease H3TH domain-containing protein, partial [Burkholderiales bacterium]|nr:5'-3' exonuclease H3TH domain-containing protein [Burkholderiales bacterium]